MKKLFLHQLLFPLLLIISLIQAMALRSGDRVHNNDFKHLWAGGKILAEGGNPYDAELMLSTARKYGLGAVNPYVYLPATGLLMRPLAALSFHDAEIVWFWLNWTLAWIAVLSAPWLLKVERPWLARLAGALFLVGAFPFMRQMTAGQMNVALMGMLLGALALLIRGREIPVGALLGVAAAFKIAPLFFLLPLAGMRRWRAASALLASFAIINLAATAWSGWDVTHAAWPVLRSMGYGQSTWADFGNDFYRDPFNQSFNSLFHHLFTENPHTTPWAKLGPIAANALTWLLSLLLLCGLGFLTYKFRTRAQTLKAWTESETLLFHLSTIAMLLLPSIFWDHYVVQLIPAIVWLFGSLLISQSRPKIILSILAFFLVAYPWPHLAPAFSHGPGILLMSIRLWGTLLFGLLLWLAAQERTKA